jgi:division protein CdvB (Snf7/Vps24/ESCRT-III family)
MQPTQRSESQCRGLGRQAKTFNGLRKNLQTVTQNLAALRKNLQTVTQKPANGYAKSCNVLRKILQHTIYKILREISRVLREL